MVDPWSAGVYGNERAEDRGKRLSRRSAGSARSRRTTAMPGPIEGVIAVVDLNRDGGAAGRGLRRRPAAAGAPATGRASTSATVRGDLKPLEIVAARRAELHGRRPRGPLAEVEVPHRLHPARGAGAAHASATRRRPRAADPATARRSPRWSCPTATPASSTTARTPSTSASTASACWPTRWRSAATAWGRSATSTPT